MSEIEETKKKIIENLKNVQATTVDYSYYSNGQPGPKDPAYMSFDKSENAQAIEDSK